MGWHKLAEGDEEGYLEWDGPVDRGQSVLIRWLEKPCRQGSARDTANSRPILVPRKGEHGDQKQEAQKVGYQRCDDEELGELLGGPGPLEIPPPIEERYAGDD